MRDITVDKILVKYMDALDIMQKCCNEYCTYMKETENDETYDKEDYISDFDDLVGNELMCNCEDGMYF